MVSKSPFVDVLRVVDVLLSIQCYCASLTVSELASSMDPLSCVDAVDDVEHSADAFFAEIDASPGRYVLVPLLPFLVDEAVDPDSACEAEPIRALVLILLELDGLVPPEFGSAA